MIYSVVYKSGPHLVAQGEIDGNPLDEAIRKWQFIVQWASDHNEYLEDGGPDTCALCMSYKCSECPVYAHTRQTYCLGSPYRDYVLASQGNALAAAKAELAFLEGLRVQE